MKQEKTPLLRREGSVKLLSSLLSIVIGLVVGGLIVLFVGLGNSEIGADGAGEGLRLIFAGILSTGRDASGALSWGFNPTNVGNMLFRAMPVIMTGLSVAVAFKTGLFNIGAPGQYLMGTMVSLVIALSIDTAAVPAGLVWVLALLGGIAAGALWGCIPGLVKAFLNINEVLACIMTNWIAANVVTWIFDGSAFRNMVENTKSGYIYKTSFNGIPVALLALNNPIGVIFAGLFMAMLNIIGLQLTNLTAYNEFITDVIIAIIVYLSAFSLVIRMFLMGRKRKVPPKLGADDAAAPAKIPAENEKGGDDA